MAKQSKKYRRNHERLPAEPLSTLDAVKAILKYENARFDETVELAVRLGIDPKNSTQGVRGAFSLPNGIGRSMTVIAFAEGDAAAAAEEAGADAVGGEDLAKRILDGWLDFDVAIAHPGMMRHVGKLGRILGPQGKMPSPRSGTVTDNVGPTVAEFAAGKIEYRLDSGANIHVPVGKKSFENDKLKENIEYFVEHIEAAKPVASKGTFVINVALTSTMGPGIRLAAR